MIRKAIGPAMFDVARCGAIRRRNGLRQHITGKEPGEMGGAPNIATTSRITRPIDARSDAGYELGTQRTEGTSAATRRCG